MPSPTDLDRLRQAFARVHPIPDDVWADLRRPWTPRTVRRGEWLTAEGETERTFSLVTEGVQRLWFTGPDGGDHTVAFVSSGDFSGVPDSLFLQAPSAYTLEAVTDGRQLEIGHADLMRLLDRHRPLERWARRLFLLAAAGRAKREREHLTQSAAERYARLLRESPHVLRDVPLKHVASYLGMSAETLSRVRSSGS